MDFSTDLVPTLPGGASPLPTIFDSSENLERVLVQIEKRALSETFDMADATSRKACASLAYKVARSRTAIAGIGSEKAADLRAGWDAINTHRRVANDRLNALRDKVRAPLNAWDEAEKERVAAHEDRLTTLRAVCDLTAALGSTAIREHIKTVGEVTLGDQWDEFEEAAGEAKTSALIHLGAILETAEADEQARAELEQLRREKAERDEADQRAAAEAEIKRREDAAADRARKLAEVRASEAVEREKDKAEREVRDANLRAQKADQDARDAVDRERQEVAAREKVEADAKAKREADDQHNERIEAAIASAIIKAIPAAKLKTDDARRIVAAIRAGHIPHVQIVF